MREIPDHEKGPDPYEPAIRRRNLRTLLSVAALVAVAALLPGTCRRFTSPDAAYPTAAEAVRAGAFERGQLPRFLPEAARDVRVRHDRDSGRRFVRFDYDSAWVPAMTEGMRAIPEEEKEQVPVPSAGWASWFPITERTLSGRQGEYLQLYEVIAGPDRGWLALDPRTLHAYYWSPGAS